MESSLQRIVSVIVAVLMLFVIPVYIAFEKVDDITYSLLLKQTQTFVDNVRNKGYISPEMYGDYVSEIYALSNNSYDINIEYTKKRTDPAIYIYERVKDSEGNIKKGKILYILDYQKYLTEDGKVPAQITINEEKYDISTTSFSFKEPKILTSSGETVTYVKNSKVLTPEQLYLEKIYDLRKDGYIEYGESVWTKDDLNIIGPGVKIKNANTGNVISEFNFNDTEHKNIYSLNVQNWENFIQNIYNKVTYIDGENCIIEVAHVVNEEIITDKQIVNRLFYNTGITKLEFLRQCFLGNADLYNSLSYVEENSYILNEGDKISVTVKNKNQTIASVFYSMFTANVGFKDVAKIYVNYGGTIKNSGEKITNTISGNITDENGLIFKYKGEADEITLEPGMYQIEAWGASGGGYEQANSSTTGGKGSYVKSVFDIDKETTLYVYVGGQGTKYSNVNEENGGYNGGGNSYNGYGGGGASDVRLLKGEWDDVDSLLSRIIVAAGGGGSSKSDELNNYRKRWRRTEMIKMQVMEHLYQ